MSNGTIVNVTVPSVPAVVRVATPGPPGIGLPAGVQDAGKFVRKAGSTAYAYELVTPDQIAGVVAYIHSQSTAATTWIINHNLGYRPTVELLDSGSQEIDGEVAHPTVNQTVVTLNPATAGLARLL